MAFSAATENVGALDEFDVYWDANLQHLLAVDSCILTQKVRPIRWRPVLFSSLRSDQSAIILLR